MIELIDYIQRHGLQNLCDTYHIKAKRHAVHTNLVLLKYDQIESPMGERIVQQARGIIVDEANDWRIICWPYDKFFNHGDGHAAEIDWWTARVYEKLDGSLMSMYFYADEWHVASSGTPDAGGDVYGHPFTFAQLFWRVWKELGYKLPLRQQARYTFIFELMTPYNRIIVPQAGNRIVLHGCRDIESGQEVRPEGVAVGYGWECVKSYPLQSLSDIITAANAIDPMQGEGYVVCDDKFNRLKVKSPQYVALAHLKDGMSGRRLLEIVRANEGSEFLVHFPEWRASYDEVRAAYDYVCDTTSETWEQIRGIEDRKAFALEAVKAACPAALFALRDGKAASVREFFRSATIQSIERAVKLPSLDLTAA